MNSVEPDKQQQSNARSSSSSEPESVTQGVADVMNAFFSVGASLAKTVAEATANTKPVPAPPPSAAPLNAIIHYGLITVGNVINLFAGGIKSAVPTAANVGAQGKGQAVSGAAGTTAGSSGTAGSDATLPLVQRGGTLRIPLSIENPVNEPMEQLTFLCLTMQGGTPGQGIPLTVSAVRFQPETISIAPRDFEKLTVFIDTSHETSPGRYEATLGLGGGSFEMSVQFEVLPQTI